MNALNAHRSMSANTTAAGKSMEKLSSGLRINRAGDDAAGLAISEKMRGQIRGLNQASRNAQDGISLIQTAEGALNETHAILQRMRELAVQASTDTNTLDDRKEIQKEINQLLEEIDRIADNTEFNTKKLINGDLAGTGAPGGTAQATVAGGAIADLDFNSTNASFTINGETITLETDHSEDINDLVADIQGQLDEASVAVTVGLNEAGDGITLSSAENIVVGGDDFAAVGLAEGTTEATGAVAGGSISALKVDNVDTATTGGVLTQAGADAAITNINKAITQVSAERSKLGAYQNRLEHTINNLGTSAENLTAAESRIRDVDMAKEMMNFSKNNILQQAAQAMLAQANQQPQGVLQLLR